MIWEWSVAIDLPTNVIAMHASFPALHIGAASSDIVLHTNWFVLILSKLDCTSIRDLDTSLTFFATGFSFPLGLAFLWIRLEARIGGS